MTDGEDTPTDGEETPKKKGGCLKALGCGCLVVILLVVGGGFGLVFGIRNAVTDTESRILSQVNADKKVSERADSFVQSVSDGKSARTLVLTSADINSLIQNHPSGAELAGKVYVSIENDKVKGQVSVPLDEAGWFFKGRHFNGSCSFSVAVTSGRLFIFVEALEVKGKQAPDWFMEAFSSENLAKNANTDPDLAEVLQKLESITVKDNAIYIVPKSSQ